MTDPDISPAAPVTITTVLYNSAATVPAYARCLQPVLREGLASLVLVDNASPDRSGDQLEALLPEATLIRSAVNGGFAAGCNLAWPSVSGRYWLLLNPDVYVGIDGVRQLTEWMDRRPRVGIATPLIAKPSGVEVPVAIPHDTLWRPLLEMLRLHKCVPEPLRSKFLLTGRRHTPEQITGWVTGAAMIVRTEMVRRVGLMDEGFFMYGEEREWCWRIAQAGWGVGVCQDVTFVHETGASAVATWGGEERVRREVAGHLRVSRKMRGESFTRMLALCLGVTLWVGAIDLRRWCLRDAEQQLRARAYLKSWWRPSKPAPSN